MIKDITANLLAWYDRHHRDLPWRISPSAAKRGVKPDPYCIWMSEVMRKVLFSRIIAEIEVVLIMIS